MYASNAMEQHNAQVIEQAEMKRDPKYKRNERWYQMSKHTSFDIMALNSLGAATANTFMVLLNCSSRIGACIISQRVLAHAIGVKSYVTVYRAIKKLIRYGYIADLKIKSIRQNVYVLNPNLVWQKSSRERVNVSKLFKFPVNIILSDHDDNIKRIKENLKFAKRHSNRQPDLSTIQREKIGYQTYIMKKSKHKEQVAKEYKNQKIKNKLKKEQQKIANLKKQLK